MSHPSLRVNPDILAQLSPLEQEKVAAELLRIERLLDRNPLQSFNLPGAALKHPKQLVFLASRDRTKAFFGGNQSGKTTAGVVDDIIQCVDRDALPKHLQPYKQYDPPFYCRIGTPDLGKTMSAVQEKLKEWLPKDQLVGGSWETAYKVQDRILHFTNGSFIEFMSYDQKRDQWGSATRHRVHFDEEPPEELRNEALARVMRYGGDLIFTMTPHNGMTYLFDQVFERRHEDGITVVTVDIDDNPHLNEGAKDILLEGLSDEERQQRKEGKFVHVGGLVLAEFDDDFNLCDPISPAQLRGHTVVDGIDPGMVRGGVVFCSFDRDDTLLVFDELYPQNETIERVALKIIVKNARYLNGTRLEREWAIVYMPTAVAQGWMNEETAAECMHLLLAPYEREVMYVIDPSARNRSHINADNVEAALQRCGIFCLPGQNSLEAGAYQLKRRLQRRPHAALIVARNCVNWLWEKGRWKRKPMPDDSFAVVPGNDHLLDPTRYVAQTHHFGPDDAPKKDARRGYQHGHVDPDEYDALPARDVPPMGEWS